MTRKHFEAIASALKLARAKAVNEAELVGVDRAIREVTLACASFNENFDHKRFDRACGLEGS